MRTHVYAGVLAVTVLSATSTHATVVYDSFGPNNSYENYGVWFGTRPAFPDNTDREATRFQSAASGPLTRITTGMFYVAGTNAFTLTLAADDAGGPPGTTLWSKTVTNKLGAYGSSVTLADLSGPQLTAGTDYWLIADAPSSLTYHNWHTGKQGTAVGARFATIQGNTWNVFSPATGLALRVETPEPASLAGLGALAIAFRQRRRR